MVSPRIMQCLQLQVNSLYSGMALVSASLVLPTYCPAARTLLNLTCRTQIPSVTPFSFKSNCVAVSTAILSAGTFSRQSNPHYHALASVSLSTATSLAVRSACAPFAFRLASAPHIRRAHKWHLQSGPSFGAFLANRLSPRDLLFPFPRRYT